MSQDKSENYPFIQQKRNRQQAPYYTPNYLSSSDDDYYQLDIFALYTQENCVQQPRPNLAPQNKNSYPQNSARNQTYQPLQTQNPTSAQSYQPVQIQNPVSTHSYQPTQMQNEIPLPYYLQQHEITKSHFTNFSQIPNATKSLQMTMNPYLMGGLSITSNKPLMVFTGTDPEYAVEDYLNTVTANLNLNIGPAPINTPLHQNWIHGRTELIQTTLVWRSSERVFSFTLRFKIRLEKIHTRIFKNV